MVDVCVCVCNGQAFFLSIWHYGHLYCLSPWLGRLHHTVFVQLGHMRSPCLEKWMVHWRGTMCAREGRQQTQWPYLSWLYYVCLGVCVRLCVCIYWVFMRGAYPIPSEEHSVSWTGFEVPEDTNTNLIHNTRSINTHRAHTHPTNTCSSCLISLAK